MLAQSGEHGTRRNALSEYLCFPKVFPNDEFMRRPELSIPQILRWVDDFHARTGRWPKQRDTGRIAGSLGETWSAVNQALIKGLRGFPGGSSLPRLLAERRGVRNRGCLPRFTERQVLAWADAHHRRTGKWPNHESGAISQAPGETWLAVAQALRGGIRGLPGGTTLARFLTKHRNVPNHLALPRFTVKQVLAWADAYHRRHRRWPKRHSGAILEAPTESWGRVNTALIQGNRGFAGRSSLSKLLAKYRRVKGRIVLPKLRIRDILAWADHHFRRTGFSPTARSGRILAAPNRTWGAVHQALHAGWRGFPGGDSLSRLLLRHGRSAKARTGRPPPSDLLKAKNSRRASPRWRKNSTPRSEVKRRDRATRTERGG